MDRVSATNEMKASGCAVAVFGEADVSLLWKMVIDDIVNSSLASIAGLDSENTRGDDMEDAGDGHGEGLDVALSF